MSWMQQLEKVYNENLNFVGEFEERRNQRITLLPVSHVMQSAQIEVLVSAEGDFVSAKVVEKEQARTIVPVTLSSANRTSTSAPHYLHDKLFYVAGDYVAYGGLEKRASYYQDYMQQMARWAEDENVPKRVKAIYNYVRKGTLIHDLVNEKILPIDEKGQVIAKWTDGEKPPIYQVVTGDALEAFVRFDVLHETPAEPVVWEDKALFDAFITYFQKTYEGNEDLCYVSGETTILTSQHGGRVRNAGDMSKLISANDSSGFTYRGRFAAPSEAVQIGYEVSQKAHHAMRWLMQRQSTYVDSRYFVSFGTKTADVPDAFDSSLDFILGDIQQSEDVMTAEIIATKIQNALQGLKYQLTKEDLQHIIVLAVDAATSGRLALVYYQELHPEQFAENIKYWHDTCRWLLVRNIDKKLVTFIGTPSTYQIVEAVYGSKADSKIKKGLYTRLLPCIVERKPIPKDIVQLIFNRIKNPASFKGTMESWEGTVRIACALIAKLYEKEGYTVALQEENQTRDYLFGRLLGVAEVMERSILKERNDDRATNATRYFNAFSQNPARTWLVIRRQLQPYFARKGAKATYYAKLLQQIEEQLAPEYMTNQALSPVFVLGYSSQIQKMYEKKEEVEQ